MRRHANRAAAPEASISASGMFCTLRPYAYTLTPRCANGAPRACRDTDEMSLPRNLSQTWCKHLLSQTGYTHTARHTHTHKTECAETTRHASLASVPELCAHAGGSAEVGTMRIERGRMAEMLAEACPRDPSKSCAEGLAWPATLNRICRPPSGSEAGFAQSAQVQCNLLVAKRMARSCLGHQQTA